MNLTKVTKIEFLGNFPTIDIEVDNKNHNFYANGIVVSNSHAVAYSKLSALTVYLKFNYPKEFFLECLNRAEHKADTQNEIYQIATELPKFGIKLLPPDLLKSELEHTIEGNNIRFGLKSIKGISDKSISNILDFIDKEKTNKFSVFQAAKEAKVKIDALAALIQTGVLTSISENRPKLVLESQLWSFLTEKERIFCIKNGEKYNYDLFAIVKDLDNWKNDVGKPISAKTRKETIKKKFEKPKEIYDMNSKYPKFAAWAYERKLLGYSYSTSLKEVFINHNPELRDLSEISKCLENEVVEFIAEVVEDTKKATSKNDKKYIKFLLSDGSAYATAMLFDEGKVDPFLEKNKLPKEGEIIYCKGRKSTDIIWLDKVEPQNYRIYLKYADFKEDKSEENNVETKTEE